ncbi:MAG: hypothetical protein QXQ46_11215 [Thermoplasmatales archaeon]
MKHERVRRWYENLNANSILTGKVWLRILGYYCELENTAPDILLQEMKKDDFRDKFADFVRKLEKEGKAGTYIKRFKNVLRSFAKFNGITMKLSINIAGDRQNLTIENERVPSKEELSRLLRKATSRGKVAVSLMAYSGLRPESLSNYQGTDGLRSGDLKELNVDTFEFERIPCMVSVKSLLSKARHKYFSFLGEEDIISVKEYLEERRKKGEILTEESALLQFEFGKVRHKSYLRTTLITRDIKDAIEKAGLIHGGE